MDKTIVEVKRILSEGIGRPKCVFGELRLECSTDVPLDDLVNEIQQEMFKSRGGDCYDLDVSTHYHEWGASGVWAGVSLWIYEVVSTLPKDLYLIVLGIAIQRAIDKHSPAKPINVKDIDAAEALATARTKLKDMFSLSEQRVNSGCHRIEEDTLVVEFSGDVTCVYLRSPKGTETILWYTRDVSKAKPWAAALSWWDVIKGWARRFRIWRRS